MISRRGKTRMRSRIVPKPRNKLVNYALPGVPLTSAKLPSPRSSTAPQLIPPRGTAERMPDGGSVTLLTHGGGGVGIGTPVTIPDTIVLNLDLAMDGKLLADLKKQHPSRLLL